MYKIVIADDEPKIRRGLKKINWNAIEAEVVGEAINGEEALSLIKEVEPHIALIDINMPIMNGLELIREINNLKLDCLVIIISGYDEFEYAREALKENVYDYILKPVDRNKLLLVVSEALLKLDKSVKKDKLIEWANNQVVKESESVIKNFFRNWLAGSFNDYEIQQNLDVFGLNLNQFSHFVLIKTLGIIEAESVQLEVKLQEFCITNIIQETMKDYEYKLIVSTESDTYVVLFKQIGESSNKLISQNISINIHNYLSLHCLSELESSKNLDVEFPKLYQSSFERIRQLSLKSPQVQLCLEYINSHYTDVSLSIEDVAKYTRVSTSYLSKALRKELGNSYTDLVTKLRIESALELMKDPMLRIYDISEQVGYSTQHYFSTAFKKIMGTSPAKYRKDIYHE